MRTAILAALLLVILGFTIRGLQDRVRAALRARPFLLFLFAALLSALFLALAAWENAFSAELAGLILAYTFVPVMAAFAQRNGVGKRPTWLDFAIILWLWLPLEFAAGARLIPRPAQGFLHSVAYGVAILLGLVIFLGSRHLAGMKYNPPAARDLLYGVAGFAITAPVLVWVGRLIDFIPPLHAPAHPSPISMGGSFQVIFVATALPEEILFRSLIQNWFTQRYGYGPRVLLIAGLIFGCAHLDNGPQPLPNWRYMILATIAGVAYGKVFQKSGSVFSSVTFHALVDVTKHIFF